MASLSDHLRALLQLTGGFRVSKGRYRIEDRFEERCIVQGAMKAVGLAIALQVVAPAAYGQTAEPPSFRPVSARHCPDEDAFSLERPDPDGGPTKVGFAVRINDIIALDDVQRSMQLDAYSIFQWLDPRLANSLRGEASVACPLPLDRMWSPRVQVVNLRSTRKLYEDITLVDGEGVVSLIRREMLEVAVPLDYREFPFDAHSLSVSFSPIIFDDSEIVFEALPGVKGANDAFSLEGWAVDPPSISITTEPYPGRREGQESRITITMQARRETGYWIYKLVIPLILIVLMSGSVFFLPPESNRSQIAVAVTTMLTLIAYQFALANDLPRVSYLTRADHLILGSSILVFGALIKATAVAVLLAREKEEWIALLYRVGRWAFGLGFLFILWFSLLR